MRLSKQNLSFGKKLRFTQFGKKYTFCHQATTQLLFYLLYFSESTQIISHFGHNLEQCAPTEKIKGERPPNFAGGGNYVASCRDAIIIGH